MQCGQVPEPKPSKVIKSNDIIRAMERQKAFLGWKCKLSPDEVQLAKEE